MTFYQISIFCKIIKNMLIHRVPLALPYIIIKLRNLSISFVYQNRFLKYSSKKLHNHDNCLADIKWPSIQHVLGHDKCIQQKIYISFIFWKWKLANIKRTYVWNKIHKYSQLKPRFLVSCTIEKNIFYCFSTSNRRDIAKRSNRYMYKCIVIPVFWR